MKAFAASIRPQSTGKGSPTRRPAVVGFFRRLLPRLMLAGLIFLGGGEIVCRCYLWLARDVPFWSSGCIWYAYYPSCARPASTVRGP
jgi:hypothetical protein